MLDSLVRIGEIDDVLSAIVSADEVERHKPAVELYEHAADRLNVDPTVIAHVSNSPFDIQGAMHAETQGIG